MGHALSIHDGLGVIAQDPALGILLAYGNTLPVDGTVGYATGCHWIKTNGTNLPNSISINTGTRASSSFVSTFVATNVVQTLTNKTLTSPVINGGTGTSLAMTAGITSSSASAGIGYATGAGSSVAQATDRTTTVVCNGMSGAITTQATSIAAQTSLAFTVTNSSVAIGDVIVLSIRSGPTGLKTIATVTTVAAGSFQINLFNGDAAVADTGAAIINFAVIKAVSA